MELRYVVWGQFSGARPGRPGQSDGTLATNLPSPREKAVVDGVLPLAKRAAGAAEYARPFDLVLPDGLDWVYARIFPPGRDGSHRLLWRFAAVVLSDAELTRVAGHLPQLGEAVIRGFAADRLLLPTGSTHDVVTKKILPAPQLPDTGPVPPGGGERAVESALRQVAAGGSIGLTADGRAESAVAVVLLALTTRGSEPRPTLALNVTADVLKDLPLPAPRLATVLHPGELPSGWMRLPTGPPMAGGDPPRTAVAEPPIPTLPPPPTRVPADLSVPPPLPPEVAPAPWSVTSPVSPPPPPESRAIPVAVVEAAPVPTAPAPDRPPLGRPQSTGLAGWAVSAVLGAVVVAQVVSGPSGSTAHPNTEDAWRRAGWALWDPSGPPDAGYSPEHLQADVRKARDRIKDDSKRIPELSHELRYAQQERDKREQELKTVYGKVESLERLYASEKQQVSTLNVDLTGLRGDKMKLGERVKQLDTEVAGLKTDRGRLEKEKTDAELERDKLKRQVNDLSEKLRSANLQLTNVSTALKDIVVTEDDGAWTISYGGGTIMPPKQRGSWDKLAKAIQEARNGLK